MITTKGEPEGADMLCGILTKSANAHYLMCQKAVSRGTSYTNAHAAELLFLHDPLKTTPRPCKVCIPVRLETTRLIQVAEARCYARIVCRRIARMVSMPIAGQGTSCG